MISLGLFLISVATLIWEVLLTRIFSIYLWSYFAFLVLSLALLGFGASGSFLQVFSPRRKKLPVYFLLFFFSASIIYLGITRIPFDPVRIAWDPWQFFWLAAFYLAAALPCFFSGCYAGSCFALAPEKSSRRYGVNLVGSAVGALLSLPFLTYVPLEGIGMSPYKALPQALVYPESKLLATRWGVEARVDLVKSGAVRFAPGLSLNFLEDLPEQLGVTLDGDRLNAVTRFAGDPGKLRFLGELPSSAAYSLLTEPSVLVIESSGGLNILEALHHGAMSVDAQETNDRLVSLINEDWGEFSGRLYSHPKVQRIRQHVRHYLKVTEKPYDLIVLSLSDNPGAASTGLYGLNENYLYTVEAFQAYLDHLKPEGFFTVTRYLLPPPREEPRSLVLASTALASRGAKEPATHLAMIESYGTWTLLMKKSPLNDQERRALEEFSVRKGFTLLHPVALPAGDSLFDLSPATDRRPYFFHFFQLAKLPETYRLFRDKWEAFFEAGYLVHFAFLQAIFWGCLLILAPLLIRRRESKISLRTGAYFFLIGLGFMFVEMAFLQKAIFLFGNPTYGFSVLLALLLLFSGLGSATLRLRRGVLLLFLLIIAAILLSLAVQDWSFSAIIGIPLFYLMGAPFPLALSQLERAAVPMAWAFNGIASVLGSILAVIIAMEWGYGVTLFTAALFYFLAGLAFAPHRSSGQSARQ